ncbi:monovalent cation/H+ antiporter subunit A [Amaricoccus solimangrovi]|uniref:Monovalent cation/H+ antiporter subunit A n=1 Tax=Amaricoccus solimangrovi TaxID=2589815 RepID=A0A501WM56_9RHOB|nr:monovalent cation/H+ antiporter subunit A [Amaricoccus solimangrovi]TPE49254.1 monovalent cation/H+ antiporter subunit A [Amaricoccus solimangrovi]
MVESNLLLILLILPFAGSVVAATSPANLRNAEVWLSAAVSAVGLGILAALRGHVTEGGVVEKTIRWMPSFGLDFALRVDGFAWIFLVLILGIGLLVVIYARYYLSARDPAPRFYASLLAFMGAMTGLVMSGNLILLLIFWELTSLVSFLLIGYWHQNAQGRDGARMSLIVTGAGGLCLLAGLLVIGHVVGSYDLDTVLASGDRLREDPLYLTALILVMLGAFTKSAQVPFHFWLPHAMAAPTPVSAYLHSATMVKAGVFLLLRFAPVLNGTEAWFWVVGGVGMTTLLLGAFFAFFQHDLKGLLAYSTISHLGLITALAGIGTPEALVAATFHIINHAVFKASLFMAAGIIDHETGTRDMRRLGGLRHAMPYTATLAIVASASMAGIPLLNGFLSKEMFFAETIEAHDNSAFDQAMPWIALVASALAVAYSLRFIVSVFFGPTTTDCPRKPHEPPHWMRFPIEILVAICLLVGILPGATIAPYLRTAVVALLGDATPDYSLALWHGVNAPFVMSVIALVAGCLIYALLARHVAAAPEGPPVIRRLEGQRIFERMLLALSWRWMRALHRLLGTERLQVQLRILVLMAAGAATATFLRDPPTWAPLSLANFDPLFALVWLVGAACAIGAAWQAKYHRFAALVMLGGAGTVTCVTFAWFSAPDLSVTQLLVEIVTTVLLLLGLRWLPKRNQAIRDDVEFRARARRFADLIVAVFCGAGIAMISYTVMSAPLDREIATYFLEHAYSLGGGTNVVNVILVDFRGFDTFGEITVLGIVGLTVFALLRRFRPARESDDIPEQQRIQRDYEVTAEHRRPGETLRDYMFVPSVIMRWMFPATIMIAAYLFLRGHDLPGGGFAAGVALAIGFLLQYLGADARWVEDRLRILPIRWIGFGLLIAAATGLGSWMFGFPFLTAHARYLEVPLVGKVPFATALIFDFGVFTLVVGATVLVLIAIAHQSLRSKRDRPPEEEPDPDLAGPEAEVEEEDGWRGGSA